MGRVVSMEEERVRRAAAELYSYMTARGVNLGGVGGGGRPLLTGMDVAGALGMAKIAQGPYLMGLAKYGGDGQALKDLYYYAWMEAADIAVARKWDIERGKPRLRGISALAVDEVVGHHKCDKCQGTGYNAAHRRCSHCQGTTIEPHPSERMLARKADIPEASWRSKWKHRYVKVLESMRRWDATAQSAIRRGLDG